MKSVVRMATVDPNDATRATLKNMLLGIDIVWLEAECSRYEFFPDVINQSQPDMALVSLDADPDKALNLIQTIRRSSPGISILCVSSSQEGSLILRAMRNGASEFLNSPLQLDDFISALDRIRQQMGGKDGDSEDGTSQVISVAGVSGGVGSTSLAINLGCVLAQNPRNSVVILDLDMTLGDADVWLDIIPDYTIQDVAENIARLDFSLLKRSLTKHECGAFLLPRPVQIETHPVITPDELRRFIALLKATFTHLIVDTSKAFGALDMAVMEISDQVLLLTQLDLSCLRNVVRLMQMFEGLDDLPDKTHIIVNRTGLEDSEISLNKALETIGREVYWQLPNDYATMVDSRNNGVPLCIHAPKAKLTKSIEALVRNMSGNGDATDGPGVVKKKKRLFSFLGN
jgi:pilus assembly protein CpaE